MSTTGCGSRASSWVVRTWMGVTCFRSALLRDGSPCFCFPAPSSRFPAPYFWFPAPCFWSPAPCFSPDHPCFCFKLPISRVQLLISGAGLPIFRQIPLLLTRSSLLRVQSCLFLLRSSPIRPAAHFKAAAHQPTRYKARDLRRPWPGRRYPGPGGARRAPMRRGALYGSTRSAYSSIGTFRGPSSPKKRTR
jgi:hypothetical protein